MGILCRKKVIEKMFSEEMLLTTKTARHLYHDYAEGLPIIDYHCHLIPEEILEDRVFEDLGEAWLAHDHYKWRAMRTFGIGEEYITGGASFHDKFVKFAEIMPYLAGNPIYPWCALELKRYFGVDEPLGPDNAEAIYGCTKRIIRENHISPRKLIADSRVEFICTSNQPAETLETYKKLRDAGISTLVTASIRADGMMAIGRPGFAAYLNAVCKAAGTGGASCFGDIMAALEKRMEFFRSLGSHVCDLGIDYFRYEPSTPAELDDIAAKGLADAPLTEKEIYQYQSAFAVGFGVLCHKLDCVLQLHMGTYHAANAVMTRKLGGGTGFDCTDDRSLVRAIGGILNGMEARNAVPRTLLYPLNITHMEAYSILAAGFCGGNVRGRVQLGAPWWFNDQIYGLRHQFESVSNLYPLSLSVGMLTDSRSFLSYTRYEIYRRVFCDFLGGLVERGEYFSDDRYLRDIVLNVCYRNAKEFFSLG